jgi:AhpD family alkylhydroperoxidase
MTEFRIHDSESAPEESRPLLDSSKEQYGMIPNLHGVMAEAPAALEAYQTLNELFTQKTSLSPEQQNVVWLTIAVENGCHYCVPAHTAIAKSMKVSDEVVEALRGGNALSDPGLEALRVFTQKVVRQRGGVSDEDVREFIDAGHDKQQVLEVVLGVSQKVLSNYINAIADTPVDEPFRKFEWRSVA